jgi:hypothetical protein
MSTRPPTLTRQGADDAAHVPNEAAGVLARADDREDPAWITFIDTNREAVTEAWISCEPDVIQPVGGPHR